MSEVENHRHAETRGKLLNILAEDYNTPMTSVGTIARALDLRGYPLTIEALNFHLNYLADSGYLKLWRSKDMAGFRRDRASFDSAECIRFAHLLPKGVQLIDGDIAEDPKVTF